MKTHRQSGQLLPHGSVGRRESGFTIVELLIVIVVIAILAAISIVAYNSVQNRAKASAAQSAVAQANKKVASYVILNTDTYPATLADVGVSDSGGTVYGYSVNPTAKTYCITATVGGISYYQNNTTQQTPVAGGCPGHAQGGAIAVTNRFQNPNFSGPSGPATQSGASRTLATCNGSMAAQATTTTSSDASIRLQPDSDWWAISPGQAVYASSTIYNAASAARIFALSLRWYDSSGTQLSATSGTTQSVAAGTALVLSVSSTAPASTVYVGVNANRTSGSGAVSGDIYCADNVFLSDTAAGYADGSSPNWIWNGTPNSSTSTGPAL